MPGPGRCADSNFSNLSGGSGRRRAWLCAFVLVFNALRGILDRRILRLLRVNGFPSFESVQVSIALAEQSALCTTAHYAPHHRHSHLLNRRSSYLRCLSRVPCAPFFLYFPQASLHCCGLLVSSPGLCSFPWLTLARSAFHCFRIGFKRCKCV